MHLSEKVCSRPARSSDLRRYPLSLQHFEAPTETFREQLGVFPPVGTKPLCRVGRLDFRELSAEPRSWVIGAAPLLPPHWEIRHRERSVARLVFMFQDDDEAGRSVGDWLDRTYVWQNAESDLAGSIDGGRIRRVTDYMERRLLDLRISGDVSVAKVVGSERLLVWIHEVLDNRWDQLPEELSRAPHDVLLLPNRGLPSGQLALLRESACCAGKITYENPRQLMLRTAV